MIDGPYYHIDYSTIPHEIIDYDELVAHEEWNNYSSYSFRLERNVDEINKYDLEYGCFGLKEDELKAFWTKFVAWLTENGLPEDVDLIYIDVFW